MERLLLAKATPSQPPIPDYAEKLAKTIPGELLGPYLIFQGFYGSESVVNPWMAKVYWVVTILFIGFIWLYFYAYFRRQQGNWWLTALFCSFNYAVWVISTPNIYSVLNLSYNAFQPLRVLLVFLSLMVPVFIKANSQPPHND